MERPRAAFRTVIERKHPSLPRFAIVPVDVPAIFKTGTTITVTGTLNGHDLGRRGLKPWGDGRWWIDITGEICRAAGVDTGDRVAIVLEPVRDRVPAPLAALVKRDVAFAKAWRALSPGRQRLHAEWIASAKKPETVERRLEELKKLLNG